MVCPKAEVLDVAQLLLGSLDKSSVTLPEKGTAAKTAEERAARVEASLVVEQAFPLPNLPDTPEQLLWGRPRQANIHL